MAEELGVPLFILHGRPGRLQGRHQVDSLSDDQKVAVLGGTAAKLSNVNG